jgi:hypothetical protein
VPAVNAGSALGGLVATYQGMTPSEITSGERLLIVLGCVPVLILGLLYLVA